ncbi:ABC transporter permease subunit [Halobacillus litoralis]|uniref:ABC transporter permease subunit n=2 Tax=Halobacillus litoralis TaxID=45668 RepID=A0A845FGS7_9BACI|nr:ABC transporter permease subunit [Halobacillus sp. HZG1]MEC3883282.1 ABC transporter permease subunit [Halobacillus sp. HZG1]MYL72727.1 ABC transporter permease subunit [Halobacillus litoralis]
MQWMTIYKKECLESARNYKWVWVPLVFILFCIMDPLTTYYLPQILESTGGLPEGAVFDIPTPPAANVFMMSISQINTLGVLVITLITMGTIAGERKSGVAELILVKPVSYTAYVTAKWAAHVTLVLLSIFVGLIASWYYVQLLFGDVSFMYALITAAFYSLYIILVISISLFMNTWTKIPGVVLFLTISIILVLNLITSIFSHLLEWSPTTITSHLPALLRSGEVGQDLWMAALITILLIISLLFGAIQTLKRREIV